VKCVKDQGSVKIDEAVIDPEAPWKVILRGCNFSYCYKGSVSQWRSLLARARTRDPEAEWEVADRYADGCKDNRGKMIVKRSAAKAARWFSRAAEHGSAPAQNNLGIVLSNGNGVRKNVQEALFWLRKAFRGGDSCAGPNIAVTYRENGNLKAAVRWFRRAVAADDGDALVQLGIHYYWGKGVRTNPRAAVKCFRAAAKAKNISGGGRDDAFFFLGIAHLEGHGVRKSIRNAKKYLQRANIDGDNSAAERMLKKLQP
jgi:uncharacterized protein